MRQVSSLEEAKEFFHGKKYAVLEIFSPSCGPCKALEYQLDSSEIPCVKISIEDIGMDFCSIHGIKSVPAVMISSTVLKSEESVMRSPLTVLSIKASLEKLEQLASKGSYIITIDSLENSDEMYFGTCGNVLGFQHSKESALKFSSREEAQRVIGELALPIQSEVQFV